jgi:ligand-binding SRPBCC domain-containing protein
MIAGPLRRLCHDHRFEDADGLTLMRDEFEFATGFPPFDRLVLERHFRRLLELRNETIRRAAEGNDWRRYVTPAP